MVCLGCFYSDDLCVDIKSILLFTISMSRMRGLLLVKFIKLLVFFFLFEITIG